ncbi:MAG: limonene-1,2-epoxide hydrolase family protein [Acidimicrobiia bacterium]
MTAGTTADPEAVVRRLLAAMRGGTDEAFAAATALIADEGSYRPNGWRSPRVGRAAVLAELCATGAHYRDLEIEVVTCTAQDDRVVAERVDRFVMEGRPIDLHVVGIFEVGPDGLVTSWRDYYDRREVDVKLGR